MTTLQLTFLGTFKVTLNGKTAKFRSANVRGLLVYLAMHHNRPIARERLTVLFWPEETDRIGRVNLRQTIFQLRKSLGDTNKGEESNDPPFLLVDRQSVQLNPAADIQTDTTRFLEAVKQKDLEAAGILFGGELLPGFICDSSEFEQWMSLERQRLNRTALDVLSKLTEDRLKQANFTAAKSSALKQLELEPWREMAHFQLMQALALSGEREAAIEQYEKLETILLEELGRSPQPETFELIQKIENNELGTAFELAAFELPPPFQAPTVPDYLVGRDVELEALTQMLTVAEGRKEIIALVGMGGIGKTTLAAAVARNLQDQFPDGVLWGNTLLSTAENILEMWAQAYGRDFSNIADLASLAAAVRGLLTHKKVLIVLDNVTPTADIGPLLQPGSDCAMLITSRSHDASAAVGAEIFPVKELTSDSSSFLIERILDQKRLFEDEAARKAAKKIGDLLEHLPLAVEITAQLLKARPRMTLEGMVERLQIAKQRLDLKISNKAVRASFELSWEVLTEGLKTQFSNIAIFEGRSFTLEALQSLMETTEFETDDNLNILVSLSLVKLDGDSRYKQHPLLADFAAEKLEDDRPILAKLVDYYLGFSKTNALNFEGLQPEWDNLLKTILRIPLLEEWEKLLKFTDVLHESWFRFGRFDDANQIYALAETAAKKTSSDGQLAKNLLRWAESGLEQSNYNHVWEKLETIKPIFYKLEDDIGIGKCLYLQGYVLYDQGEYKKAEKIVGSCLTIFQDQNDLFNQAKAKDLLGWIFYDFDEKIDRSQKYGFEAKQLFEQINDRFEIISTLRLLACINYKQKNYNNAELLISKSIQLAMQSTFLSEEVASQYWLVSIYRSQAKYSKALKLARDTLKSARQIGTLRYEGMLIQELASINLSLGKPMAAKNYCESLLILFERIEDRLNYGYTLCRLGEIHQQLNQHDDSQKYFLNARMIANHLNHSHLKSIVERLTNQ